MELNKSKLEQLIKEYESQIEVNDNIKEKTTEQTFLSKDYESFKKEKALLHRPSNWYEKLCKAFSFINLSLAEKDKEKLRQDIYFANLNIKEDCVLHVFIGVIGISLIAELVMYLITSPFKNVPSLIKYAPLLAGLLISYYLYKYPSIKAGINRVRYGGDLMMATLYMIMYLRNSGNLEGAVRYAATHLKGKIANDLKLLLWEVETGKYKTIDEALMNYADKWKNYLKEFTQAIYLIKEALIESDLGRREMLLDKALDVILVSSDERMKGYARALELPVQVIHVIGIILPVIGLVVLPILTIMLSDKLTNLTFYLVVFYDIALPLSLWFFINNTLQKRPSTLGKVDVSEHPLLPQKGKMYYKGKQIPLLPVVGALFGTLVLIMSVLFLQFYMIDKNGFGAVSSSVLIVLLIAMGVATYYFLDSFQKVKIREEIEEVEKEFEEALFVLGNAVANNLPIEKALEKSSRDIEGLKIAGLFNRIMENMNLKGMNFKEAIFNKEVGAIKYYPSTLIKSILNIVAEAINKGSEAASLTMITISRYLRNIRTTQEKINDLLSSTLSSMKFNAYILVPVIGGVIVGVSKLVLLILLKVSGVYKEVQSSLASQGGEVSMQGLGGGFLINVDKAIPASTTQLIVGIYVIEMLIILGIFMSRIKWGFDEIKEKDETWKIVIIGTITYIITYLLMSAIFGSIVESIAMEI